MASPLRMSLPLIGGYGGGMRVAHISFGWRLPRSDRANSLREYKNNSAYPPMIAVIHPDITTKRARTSICHIR